ncbi:putative NBD/HSP70 family sugar kinase [Glaciihabitans sp. UYNi722]
MHRGASGGAGEIGYLPVPKTASSIDVDATDLQDLIGGSTVVDIAHRHGVEGTDARSIADAMVGHPERAEVFAELAPRIAHGVIPVLAILDPEVIVLGGPIGAAGGDALAYLVRREIERDHLWRPRVAGSAVEGHPVLRGAREVLMHRLRDLLFTEIDSFS